MKKALVIGYGSIGQRHVRILKEMGMEVTVVSKHVDTSQYSFPTISEALANKRFEYIVISNNTSSHYETFREIINRKLDCILLVEKPLFSNAYPLVGTNIPVYVAYNLRYHPLIKELVKVISDEVVVSVNTYVGQYLPNWRPNTDYTKSYSAHKELGGGVIRDLSHELDYLTYLFGNWTSLISNAGKISDLNIKSEDYCQVSFVTNKKININLELNYLDRITQRYMIINTNSKTIKLDFILNTINCNGDLFKLTDFDKDYTYRKQHEDILTEASYVCTFEEGYQIVQMIEAIEYSASKKEWVYNA